jgi:hypothetical protein
MVMARKKKKKEKGYWEPLKTGCFLGFLCSFPPLGLRNVRFSAVNLKASVFRDFR